MINLSGELHEMFNDLASGMGYLDDLRRGMGCLNDLGYGFECFHS